MKKKNFLILISLCLFSFILGYYLSSISGAGKGQVKQTYESEIRDHDNKYQFINPLLECQSSSLNNEYLKPFEKDLQNIVRNYQDELKIKEASIYYRDLNNGPWFGVNENIKFRPASLLKVPVLIYYMKVIEADPGILNKFVKFEKEFDDLEQMVKPKKYAEAGKTYTISELLEMMIIYSDNQSKDILYSLAEEKNLEKVYSDLNLPSPSKSNSNDDFISIKQYATFFRILYNASYVNRPLSNKALEMLSKVDFTDGLVAGVPSNIIVAHKFGETANDAENNINKVQQLHDCGIIYHPKKPYLLCVMTRGNDYRNLADFIKNASKTVYTQINHQVN